MAQTATASDERGCEALPISQSNFRPATMMRQQADPLPLRSPERHHRRALSAPRATKVKETLDARITKREDGVRLLNQYLLREEIGRGSYGTVLLAIDSNTGKEYAVKEFSKARLKKRNQAAILRRPRAAAPLRGRHSRPGLLSRPSASNIHDAETAGNPLALVRSEIAIMKKLDHENVIDLLEVLDDPEGDSLYMVVELCKKGVIMNIGFGANATPYSDEECRHWFRDLILGIEYLHAQGIAHRDIKPDNLLLSTDSVLKIVDFGVSELFEVSEDQKVAQSGSPAFMSPELCRGTREIRYLKPSDIWSMGVTLFCWKFGTLPWSETNLIELCAQIINEPPDILNPKFEYNKRHLCDDNLLDLFDKIFAKDPEARIVMADLRNHPWVTCDGEDELLSTEENTAQMVDEITEDDLRTAIKGIRGVVTVVKAVNKLKEMKAARSREVSPARAAAAAKETEDIEAAARKLEAKDSETTERGRHEMPQPSISKRSASADHALFRSNSVESRVLRHARAGVDPGREFDMESKEYDVNDDRLELSPKAPSRTWEPESNFAVQEILQNRDKRLKYGLGAVPNLTSIGRTTSSMELLTLSKVRDGLKDDCPIAE